jgi:hypothetical protein
MVEARTMVVDIERGATKDLQRKLARIVAFNPTRDYIIFGTYLWESQHLQLCRRYHTEEIHFGRALSASFSAQGLLVSQIVPGSRQNVRNASTSSQGQEANAIMQVLHKSTEWSRQCSV